VPSRVLATLKAAAATIFGEQAKEMTKNLNCTNNSHKDEKSILAATKRFTLL